MAAAGRVNSKERDCMAKLTIVYWRDIPPR